MARELIKADEGSARGPLTGNVIRCTCCCPESTHTGPDGHCIEPFCRDEPCTPTSEWRREQAERTTESSVEGRVARHLASADWPATDAEHVSLAREVIAIVEAE